MTLRVLHLVGSPTSEFFVDLSLVYARGCLAAVADPARYEAVIALVLPDGRWRFPTDLSPRSVSAAPAMDLVPALQHLVAAQVDVAVPQMFCLPGMTTYRSLLDLLGIGFVGNPADVMALAAHKGRARSVVAAAGVRVPPAELVVAGHRPSLPLPVVVKPVDADNSVGVTLVRSPDELDAALADALQHGEGALVEAYVELGREVRCGVLVRGGELVCLPLEEYAVDPVTAPIRGYSDKLSRTDGSLSLVAKDATRSWIVDPSDELTERVWAAARLCHRALGCRDYSLFDFRVDPAGTPWFLEAGLYCSFAPTSVVATMAAAAGIGLPTLFDELVVRAART